jgi:hypothetical protein
MKWQKVKKKKKKDKDWKGYSEFITKDVIVGLGCGSLVERKALSLSPSTTRKKKKRKKKM